MHDFTNSWNGYLSIFLFAVAYGFVILETWFTPHLRKSKPVLVAGMIIWILVAIAYGSKGMSDELEHQIEHNGLEFLWLLLFLLSAMTYINTLQERNVFEVIKQYLVSCGLSFRLLFWATGLLAFFISPFADNLTTALVMGAVVLAVARDKPTFVSLSCISIVVAANAGGAFSPFGDITTLMVWQSGKVEFSEFFSLFIPSLVNWLIPASIMSFFIPKGCPEPTDEVVKLKQGALVVIVLFVGTIFTAVCFHNFLHLKPAMGMMLGLGLLKIYGYFIRKSENELNSSEPIPLQIDELNGDLDKYFKPRNRPFDIFISMKRAEWDTLLFFYGIIFCVGGLGAFGYLATVSDLFYHGWGVTEANILIGVLSAIIDNIPVMFAVLSMNPDMNHGQWLLVTLTAGVGGSLLSIGSAAGVGLMGQARGIYTFWSHLRWSWAIAFGYIGSIYVHTLISHQYF